MSNWWHPSSWWSPKDVTNPKSYILHVYLSTKGRIGVATWGWFWLYLTIIWYYFLHPLLVINRWEYLEGCTGYYEYWDAPDSIYFRCMDEYDALFNSYLKSFIFVWILLLYPYFAVSVKRFHDIGYNGFHLLFCFVGAFLWFVGAAFYFMYVFRESSYGYGPAATEAKKYGNTLSTFRQIWNYESKEIQTASKWEKQRGYNEAIQIHRNLGRMGDVNRLEKAHIIYMWEKFISKKTSMESQGVICKSLISPENFSIIIENSKYKDELSDIISMSSSK